MLTEEGRTSPFRLRRPRIAYESNLSAPLRRIGSGACRCSTVSRRRILVLCGLVLAINRVSGRTLPLTSLIVFVGVAAAAYFVVRLILFIRARECGRCGIA